MVRLQQGCQEFSAVGHCLIKFVNRNDQSWILESEFLYSEFLVDDYVHQGLFFPLAFHQCEIGNLLIIL